MMGDQLDPTMSSQTSEMTKSQPKKAASRRTDIGQPDSNHSESSYSDTSHSDSTPRATSFASCLADTSSTRPALTHGFGTGRGLARSGTRKHSILHVDGDAHYYPFTCVDGWIQGPLATFISSRTMLSPTAPLI